MDLRRSAAIAVGSGLLAVVPLLPAQAVTPQVIGGQADSSPAAVALKMADEWSCSGSLWRPNIIVTAAHCLVDDDGASITAEQIRMWSPGANTSGEPSSVRVTDIVVDVNWESAESSYEATGRDVALLILNAPLGIPYWSRMATEMEAAALTWNSARAEFSGYGITTPSVDPRAELASVPTSVASTYRPSYTFGVDSFEVNGDGVVGTCGGDSGGPWMGTVAGERVLVGPLSGGQGAPCDKPQPLDKTWDDGAVASANTDLTSVALRLAGQQPDVVPTTCIKGPDTKKQCWDGRAWEYSYCWDVKKAELWRWMGGDDWKRVDRLTGWKEKECGTKTPYRIIFRGIESKKSQWYSVKIPKQTGNTGVTWDDFKATVS